MSFSPVQINDFSYIDLYHDKMLIDIYINLVLNLTTLSFWGLEHVSSKIIIALFVVYQFIFIPGKIITRLSFSRPADDQPQVKKKSFFSCLQNH